MASAVRALCACRAVCRFAGACMPSPDSDATIRPYSVTAYPPGVGGVAPGGRPGIRDDAGQRGVLTKGIPTASAVRLLGPPPPRFEVAPRDRRHHVPSRIRGQSADIADQLVADVDELRAVLQLRRRCFRGPGLASPQGSCQYRLLLVSAKTKAPTTALGSNPPDESSDGLAGVALVTSLLGPRAVGLQFLTLASRSVGSHSSATAYDQSERGPMACSGVSSGPWVACRGAAAPAAGRSD